MVNAKENRIMIDDLSTYVSVVPFYSNREKEFYESLMHIMLHFSNKQCRNKKKHGKGYWINISKLSFPYSLLYILFGDTWRREDWFSLWNRCTWRNLNWLLRASVSRSTFRIKGAEPLLTPFAMKLGELQYFYEIILDY